ncbi:MAG: 23S rRNA (guanosine(2251)-2'-O)-methyltransferase RlmB [Paludibacteraceae bacterium]|nr:23S rRNA (guanosine(2251)-2'-O)-methyltransferase RlmB [Paludibacteraceae bacterium]
MVQNNRRTVNPSEYKTRRPKEKEMIFGLRAVMEAIDAGKELDKVLIRRDMSSALAKELLGKLEGTSTTIQRVPQEKLSQFTDKNHQGVIAFISPISFYKLEEIIPSLYEQGKVPFVVILDGITDMRNFGAIARTCACAGVDAVVIPARGGVAINGDAIKTSAGALHSLPVCKVGQMQDAIRFLIESGLQVVAATEHADKNYTQADMRGPLAIIMGSEDMGIYEENLKLCSQKVRIPMSGAIESLNVSVAAGIMIYEAIRQRN